MKILQLTFTYGNNLGAMLQAYALNKVLTDMGNDCYFLPFFENPFQLMETRKSLKGRLLSAFRRLKKREYTDKWFCEFNQFLYSKCKFAPFIAFDKLSQIENDYDLFLVGSDQVWNVSTFRTEHCLLQWVAQKEKRCSYAVSLGNYSIRLKNDPVLNAIETFDAISFRERIDYEDARRNGVPCRMDVDPTFLVDRAEWVGLVNESYAFLENSVCMFGYDKASFAFAKAYAQQHGMKLVIVNYFGNRLFPGIKILNPSSPIDLLSILFYAGCVVTHSYHVFIVSLNLNKQVFVTKLHSSGKSANRISTVNGQFGLFDREAKPENMNACMDWAQFNERLSKLREDSLNYLKRITKHGE